MYDLMKRGPTSANCNAAIAGFNFDFRRGDTILTDSRCKYDAQSFAQLAKLGGWRVAELWSEAERLFAVFGLIAITPAKGE
jgi:uncharacterized SAM-dependent methyltransferase